MADNIFKRWTCKRVRELAAPGASLAEIAGMLAQTDAAPMDRSELGSPGSVNKITWQKAGRVTEPRRYIVQVRLAYCYCGRFGDLGEISERSIHTLQHGEGAGTRRRRDTWRGISPRHIRAPIRFQLFGKREMTAFGRSFCLASTVYRDAIQSGKTVACFINS
jgi:hypothetical protein